MPYLRAPDDVYRYFASRFEQERPVVGITFQSGQDGTTYTVDAEGWICRLEDGKKVRTIDPLPLHIVRRAEVLTGMRWGFGQLRLADHYPLQQTIRNLREHVPSQRILERLQELFPEAPVALIDTWGDGILRARVSPISRAGFEYAVARNGTIYARVPESRGKFVRTRGRLTPAP